MAKHAFTITFLTLSLAALIQSTFIDLGTTGIVLPTIGISLGTTALTGTALATSTYVAGIGALTVAGTLLAADAASKLLNPNPYRRRRSSPPIASCLPITDPDVFFTLAANSDHLGCGMRLVCELEMTEDDKLSKEEQLILGLFGRSPKPMAGDDLTSAKSSFQYAAFVGANAANISECAEKFNKCPFDRVTMIKAFKKANKLN